MNGDARIVRSLYRSCLREIRRLPTEYLRQFFRLHVGDNVRAALDPRLDHLRPTKIGRVQKDLRKLDGANKGHHHAFRYIMDTAYGRRGQLKWEIMQPLRTEPGVEPPPPVIPAVESSRPPIWSSEMRALVTSDTSRVTKPLKRQVLDVPPTIPSERLDPTSPESLIHGPLSKRREVNARWRFFLQEIKKTHYPLQATLHERSALGGAPAAITDEASLSRAGVRSIGLQDSGVFEEAEALACPPALTVLNDAPPKAPFTEVDSRLQPRFESHLSRRFLRRQYQALLSTVPVLSYNSSNRVDNFKGAVESTTNPATTRDVRETRRIVVSLSPYAAKRHGIVHNVMDSVDMVWMEHSRKLEAAQQKGKGKSR